MVLIGGGICRRKCRIIPPRAPAIGNVHRRTASSPVFRADGEDQIPLPERFGTDFNQADQLFFDQIVEAAAQDSVLQLAAKVNPEDKFALVFNDMLETLFIERMEQNEEVFGRYMNDPAFQKVINTWLADEVYRRLGGVKIKATTYKKPKRQD